MNPCLQARTSKQRQPNGRRKRNQETASEGSRQPHRLVLRPSKTKQVVLTFDNITISIVQVDDFSWWEKAENPYGARLWPSALGIAQFLIEGKTISRSSRVIELGCGTGLPSLVAASLGASVVATDVSTLALQLLQAGWKGCHPQIGTLSSHIFDVTDYTQPLPDADIVIASAVLYQVDLAEAFGKRVVEACNAGAWVILGDDVTGERDGGRSIFLDIINDAGIGAKSIEMTVANQELGWQAKAVKLIQLNSPDNATTK